MKIIVENKIPYIAGVLEPSGAEVAYLPPEAIDAAAVADADALIVRTRTRCDAALLAGSRVKMVATATIGTDHIDREWCRDNGIEVANAPGCNAPAVAQYVFAAIHSLDIDPAATTIGIVGAGNVGRIVGRMARAMGMRVLVNDPPRQQAEGTVGMVDLDTIAAESDIITFHVPLTDGGQWPTRHMAGRSFFSRCNRRPVIVNAARGAVVDTPALVDALGCGLAGAAVIDCWEGEPDIDTRLLNMAAIATPHIAGYSVEGKMRATAAVVAAVADRFRLSGVELPFAVPPEPAPCGDIAAVAATYPIARDDRALRMNPRAFESLRNNYTYRHEN